MELVVALVSPPLSAPVRRRMTPPEIRSHVFPTPSSSFSTSIRCGLRDGQRKPLWRSTTLSSEAIQAVHALKLAQSTPSDASSYKIDELFRTRIGRLIKADLIAVLSELRRQNQWEIALQVFFFIKKQEWYKPDSSLYSDMILMLGRNKQIEKSEQFFMEMKEEGLEPDTRAYTEIIGAYLKVGMLEKAMEKYELMKKLGCNPDKLTLTILIRTLQKVGQEELAFAVRKDCEKYIDRPEKFLEELNKEFPKRRNINHLF